MAQISLKGNPINTVGSIPKTGEKAVEFNLIKNDLSTTSLADYKGKKVILNVFPSLDTGTCAASVREFNKQANSLDNTVVLCVSRDLPFAQARFCGSEGLENVITVSDFATGAFGKAYGLEITTGPLAHLHSRVVIVINEEGVVTYSEQVPEIVDEPNYANALKNL